MRYAVGLDIGATHVRAALGNERGELSRLVSERTDSRNIEAQVYRILDGYSGYGCIGIGSVGPLDSVRGIITNPPNIRIRNFRIVSKVERRYGVRCALLNDCSAGVYGEMSFGAGKGVSNLAYVTISTGVGVGVIEDGRLLMGKDGNGHEAGHCGVDADIRMKCGCGCTGRHWEAYSSGTNIPGFVRRMLGTKYRGRASKLRGLGAGMTAKDFFDIAPGDRVGIGILDDLGRINASGISNVVNAYDPELITVGGSVALNNQALVMGPIRRHIKSYSINRVPRIVITPLKKSIILAGAVAYMLDATSRKEKSRTVIWKGSK